MDDEIDGLTDDLMRRRIGRRAFIQRASALGLAASSISTLLAACNPNAPSQKAASGASAVGAGAASQGAVGKTLTVAVEADISSLRPDRFGPFMDRYANRTLHDVLLHFETKETSQGLWYDADRYQYRIASAMDTSPDGKTITFTIRDGATFEGGKPVSADTVVKSFQWYWDNGGAARGQLFSNGIAGRDSFAVEGNKVVVTLRDAVPWGGWAKFVDLTSIIDVDEILTHATAEDKFGTRWLENNVIPSGPYKIERRTKGEQIVMVARPDYYGPKPLIERIIFQVVADPTVRYSLLKRGDVDMVSLLDFKDLEEAKNDPNIAVESWDGNNWTVLGMNWKVPEFQDRNVRKAVACAVPTDEIIKSVYYGFANPMTAPWGTTLSAGDQGVWPYTFDLDRARGYLAQSAYPSGFAQPLSITNADPNYEKAAQVIAEALGRIGIRLSIEKQTPAQIATGYAQRNIAMGLNAFTPFVHDPGYHVLWTQLPESGANWFDYNNPQAEAIAREFLFLSPKDPARPAILRRYQEILAEDIFTIPLFSLKMVIPHRKNVSGFAFFPDQPTAFRFERLKLA
jgi:peptide/nickel transport system substrate-binding protein